MGTDLVDKIKNLGIRVQILIGFIVFTIIIVVLLWIFQISLLNYFYKNIKYSEIKSAAEIIETSIASEEFDDFEDLLKDIAVNTNTDIMITDENGRHLITVTTLYSTLLNSFTQNESASIYAQIMASGGEYTRWVENNSGIDTRYLPYEELVYIKANEEYMIIMNTRVTPVDSTTDTLKFQLWCLTGIMIVLSGVLAVFISRKISKPIMKINESAKILSNGDYSVEFSGSGSKETKELSITLNEAAYELSKVEDLRRELIANVSHDLRTPLTMIIGYAEVMRDIPGENTPENVQIVLDESVRLKNLVDDILDISKIESGNYKFEYKPINLTDSIRQILHRYDKLTEYNFIFYHGEDVFVMADEIRISQVVYNIVNNAVNYTGEDKKIILTQSVQDGFVKIEITDSGEGIPQDKLKDIFKRYYKIEKEHKMAKIGSGLGLSIVKNVIEMHGGTFGVVSTEGEGSTFWFTLSVIEENRNELEN